MKTLMLAAAAALMIAPSADAGQKVWQAGFVILEPAPGPPAGGPAPGAPMGVPVPDLGIAQPMPPAGPLATGCCGGQFHDCVEVEDRDNIAPCAVERVVAIAVEDKCNCCKRCVFVKVCVPACACERVYRSKCGTKVKLDYGKYEVEIKSKGNRVKVDYDD